MSKIEFTYGKGGKKVMMARRYAETLRKLGHGTYPDEGYKTRMLTAAPAPSPLEEPRVSAALTEFAAEFGVDLETVVGTGKDGRIKKSDIEAVIAVQV
jgi:pyruvate/2-oxoglutarate dehydrogenase complex dihydrolipoamide acyltransferase (E2) component